MYGADVLLQHVTAGGMQDWNYLHSNCFEITLELGCIKYPWAKDLKGYWDANKVALLALIEEVSPGLGCLAAWLTGPWFLVPGP